jgi:molybdopterin molybdotransferase
VGLGDVVATAGTVLGPRDIALLAAVGRGRVLVHPQPRVVIISTGSELVEPGSPLAPGLIADSNGVTIAAAVQEAGAIAYRVGPLPDDASTLLAALEDQLVRADLVVTTGGVSAGAYDTVKAVLSRLGTVEFTTVAMQPGMPQGHGVMGPEDTPIFTLPGNPVSAYVSFEVFVRPVIRRMLGHEQIYRPVVRAVLVDALHSPAGKRQFARGHLAVEDGRYVVRPAGGQGSHMLGALAKANALVVIPEDVTEVKPGTAVAVLRLDEG